LEIIFLFSTRGGGVDDPFVSGFLEKNDLHIKMSQVKRKHNFKTLSTYMIDRWDIFSLFFSLSNLIWSL